MNVKRIVANIRRQHIEAIASFYRDLLDLELLMEHG